MSGRGVEKTTGSRLLAVFLRVPKRNHATDGDETMAEQQCPNCGMDVAKGSNPTEKDGQTYCCEGCANGTGCVC